MTLSESEFIQRYLAPLGHPRMSFGLKDDAAFVPGDIAGGGLIVTADALVAGVHFFEEDAPGDVAFKAVAVNVSDLAAKGAQPAAYLLTLAVPAPPSQDWASGLAGGLARAGEAFGIPLIGGDTVRARGAWWLSVTALGVPGARGIIPRGGARPGDALYVSGTVGDAALGLRLRRGEAGLAGLSAAHREHLLDRYLFPQPRAALIPALRACAHAAMDISDGLAIDLGRMCAASGVSAEMRASAVPLSAAASAAVATHPDLLETVITGGDDYEILAAVPPPLMAAFEAQARAAGVAVARVGTFTEGAGAPLILDREDRVWTLPSAGYEHF
jgi:thiamine-monophosphate kinase